MTLIRILPIFFFAISCVKQKPPEEISMIYFVSSGFSLESGKILEIKNNIGIAFYHDYILYKTTLITIKSKGNDIYLDDTTGTKSYRYFILKKGEKKGLVLSASNKWQPFNYANFLESNGLNFDKYDFFKLDLGKPNEVVVNPKTKEIIIEKFENKLKGESEPDSLYRYYNSDLVNIDFSFNPEFDTKAHSKLYKIGVLYYSNSKSAQRSPNGKKIETFWKIEKPVYNESVSLLKLFNQFILERKKTMP
jgi:hypothetical protein